MEYISSTNVTVDNVVKIAEEGINHFSNNMIQRNQHINRYLIILSLLNIKYEVVETT